MCGTFKQNSAVHNGQHGFIRMTQEKGGIFEYSCYNGIIHGYCRSIFEDGTIDERVFKHGQPIKPYRGYAAIEEAEEEDD